MNDGKSLMSVRNGIFQIMKVYEFEELMEMQENTVRSHPETTFVIAHVGSYAENLEWVSGQLEKYPNMYIDVAARLAELGRVPYSAKKFFVKHQDRILFGTDCTPLGMGYHKIYYRFFETKDEYFPYQRRRTSGTGKMGNLRNRTGR